MKSLLVSRLQYASKLLASYLLVASFITAPAIVHHYVATREATVSAEHIRAEVASQAPSTVDVSLGTPVSLTFVRQKLTLSMSKGVFDNVAQTWLVAGKDAEWIQAASSLHAGTPNAPGIIYGHALPEVMAVSLTPVPNDTVIVTYSSGKRLAYMFSTQQTVRPTDTSVLGMTDPRSLAVITCQGAFNQYRHIGFYSFVGTV